MINLKEKTQRAHETYLDARKRLDDARTRYQKGSGKVYSDHIDRQQALLTKISETKSEITGLEEAFKVMFAKAGYERTKDVKSVLREKSEAGDVLTELEAAHTACERDIFEPFAKAAADAKEFKAAYQNTYTAWARWQAYKALDECHQPIARALALLSHASANTVNEDNSFDVVGLRQKFVFDCLKELANAHPDANEPPLLPELGDCDLGPFNSRPLPSPVEISMKRKALGLATAQAE